MNFAALTTAQIVAEYNKAADALGEKPVNRFADRKTAERRTAAIVARFNEAAAKLVAERAAKAKAEAGEYRCGVCPKCGASSDITCGEVREVGGHQTIVREHEAFCHSCGHEFHYETGKAIKARGAVSASARKAIAESWKDPAVRALRTSRVSFKVTGPRIDGVAEFKSMAKALAALNLDVSKLIPLRMKARAEGSVEFGGYRFEAFEA